MLWEYKVVAVLCIEVGCGGARSGSELFEEWGRREGNQRRSCWSLALATKEETNNSRQGEPFAGSVSLLFLHNLLRVKSVRPRGQAGGTSEGMISQVWRGKLMSTIAVWDNHPKGRGKARQGKVRQGKARREGWGLGRKRWRRRGALSRCYGPDLI